MATQKTSQLAKAILQTADGLHGVCIMDDATYEEKWRSKLASRR